VGLRGMFPIGHRYTKRDSETENLFGNKLFVWAQLQGCWSEKILAGVAGILNRGPRIRQLASLRRTDANSEALLYRKEMSGLHLAEAAVVPVNATGTKEDLRGGLLSPAVLGQEFVDRPSRVGVFVETNIQNGSSRTSSSSGYELLISEFHVFNFPHFDLV
jgi:hypothetical protein